MRSYSKAVEIQNYLDKMRSKGRKIGFVATMGALHEGHMALIQEAKKLSDVVVCSIFVNPHQTKYFFLPYPYFLETINKIKSNFDFFVQ